MEVRVCGFGFRKERLKPAFYRKPLAGRRIPE
jgi:hypothetical protein